jgi:hypothetical protein
LTTGLGALEQGSRACALCAAPLPAPTSAPGSTAAVRTPSQCGPCVSHCDPHVVQVDTRPSPHCLAVVRRPRAVRPRAWRAAAGSCPTSCPQGRGGHPPDLPHLSSPSLVVSLSKRRALLLLCPLRRPPLMRRRGAPPSSCHHRLRILPEPPHGSTPPSTSTRSYPLRARTPEQRLRRPQICRAAVLYRRSILRPPDRLKWDPR